MGSPALPNPRHNGFAVASQQNAIACRNRPAARRHYRHPCPYQHTQQLENVDTAVVKASNVFARTTNTRLLFGLTVRDERNGPSEGNTLRMLTGKSL